MEAITSVKLDAQPENAEFKIPNRGDGDVISATSGGFKRSGVGLNMYYNPGNIPTPLAQFPI